MSLEVGLKKIRLILLEDVLVLLLGLGDPGLRWVFTEPDLPQRGFDCSICDREYEIFTICGR